MDFPEELKAKILECPPEVIAYIIHLHERIDQLEARVKELESRLNLNSKNSGKPPSTDGYARKVRDKRNTDKKKRGGQPGHPGNILTKISNPDFIEIHKPDFCSICGNTLESGTFIGVEKRQIFDLPPPPEIEVTEHQSFTIQCAHCGNRNSGEFPENVVTSVQNAGRFE
ncbi:MAG: DUF6444 domain-containing protein [Methanospirillum sp.]|nr:DUF6444 domain-containing protein [Methanospirillum sp.]